MMLMRVSGESSANMNDILQTCKLPADGSSSSAGAGGFHIGTIKEYQKELEHHVRQVVKFWTSRTDS